MPNCLGKGLGATGCSSQVRARRLLGGLVGRQSTVSAAHLPTTNLPQPPAAVGKEARRQGATRAPPAGRVSQGRLGRPGEYWRGPPTWAPWARCDCQASICDPMLCGRHPPPFLCESSPVLRRLTLGVPSAVWGASLLCEAANPRPKIKWSTHPIASQAPHANTCLPTHGQ